MFLTASFCKVFIFKFCSVLCVAFLTYILSNRDYHLFNAIAVLIPLLLPALLFIESVEINRNFIKIRGLFKKKNILFADILKIETSENKYIKLFFKDGQKPFKFSLIFFKNSDKQTICNISKEFADPEKRQSARNADTIKLYEDTKFLFNKTEKHSSRFQFLKLGIIFLYLVILFAFLQNFIPSSDKSVFFENFNGFYIFLILFPIAALYAYDKNSDKKTITLDRGMLVLWKANVPEKSIYLKDITFLDADYKNIFWMENSKKNNISIMGLTLEDRLEVINKIKNMSGI